MQVVQCHQHLPGQGAHDIQRYALVIKRLDQRQQVVTQDFKHHADMKTMGPSVLKTVQQPTAVLMVVWVAVPDLTQEGYLISRSFCVVLCAFLNLQAHLDQHNPGSWHVQSCWAVSAGLKSIA